MSYPINYPTPQGANIQIFSEGGTTSDWVKPQGASFVWFTLIGGGGGGGGVDELNGSSGGSSAVTNFMCPAFLIPDMLRIRVGAGGAGGTTGNNGTTGGASNVIYQQKDGTGYTLLTAAGGNGGFSGGGGGGSGGAAMTANFFTAMGFFQSIAGQNQAVNSPSATTFLSGGNSALSAANYGYLVRGNYFQLQPIIVGCGGLVGPAGNSDLNGGIGCGAGGSTNSTGGNGGDGLVVIITW